MVMLLFLLVWMIILWIGSIALEATGLERSRARFQALSALTGTGFTTSQSELIVENPRRRKIISYLIFLGNTGIMTFILLVILYTRAGVTLPSLITIAIILFLALIIFLALRLGLIDLLTAAFVKAAGKRRTASDFAIENILYQSGDYAIAALSVGEKANLAGLKGIDIIILEKDTRIIVNPSDREKLGAGNRIICHGKIIKINDLVH